MAELVYPELSYDLIGLAYKIYNKLDYGYQEKYYQRAYATELIENKYKFVQEQKFIIKYNNKTIGRYFMDFVVNEKIVVEFKIAERFYQSHINQVLAYLKSQKLRLGLLILITKDGIKYKRIVN